MIDCLILFIYNRTLYMVTIKNVTHINRYIQLTNVFCTHPYDIRSLSKFTTKRFDITKGPLKKILRIDVCWDGWQHV